MDYAGWAVRKPPPRNSALADRIGHMLQVRPVFPFYSAVMPLSESERKKERSTREGTLQVGRSEAPTT